MYKKFLSFYGSKRFRKMLRRKYEYKKVAEG